MRRAALSLLAVAALVGACSPKPPSAPTDLARDLSGKVKVDAVFAHLNKLADIANANNGGRADGTRGYDASVDYVVRLLKDKGFDVQTPEITRLALEKQGAQTVTVGNRAYSIDQASLLVQTPAGGLSAPA